MANTAIEQGGKKASSYSEIQEHVEISGVGGKKVFIVDSLGNIQELTAVLKVLAQAIANPSYVDKSANQIRSQVTGSVTATVASTTISTIDGYNGKLLMVGINNDAWANTCRRLIT